MGVGAQGPKTWSLSSPKGWRLSNASLQPRCLPRLQTRFSPILLPIAAGMTNSPQFSTATTLPPTLSRNDPCLSYWLLHPPDAPPNLGVIPGHTSDRSHVLLALPTPISSALHWSRPPASPTWGPLAYSLFSTHSQRDPLGLRSCPSPAQRPPRAPTLLRVKAEVIPLALKALCSPLPQQTLYLSDDAISSHPPPCYSFPTQ